MTKDKRVLVGMSGGIDSSAACIMLQEQGYEVVGVTMRTWDIPSHFSSPELCEWADRTGCQWIATGHYCQIEKRNGHCYIVTGDDAAKDQSYFLWKLPQEILERMLLPLGGMTKETVREYLAQKGFEAKAKGGESMEICFIDKDYRDFLREHCPDIDKRIGPGWFVDSKGLKLGQHKGFAYYTIGQRKGLGIALGEPAYVLKINPEKNTVMLGNADQLKTEYMLVEPPVAPDIEELLTCLRIFRCASDTGAVRFLARSFDCRITAIC